MNTKQLFVILEFHICATTALLYHTVLLKVLIQMNSIVVCLEAFTASVDDGVLMKTLNLTLYKRCSLLNIIYVK